MDVDNDAETIAAIEFTRRRLEALELKRLQPESNFERSALVEWRHCLKQCVRTMARTGTLNMYPDWSQHLTVLCDADAVVAAGDDPRSDEIGDLRDIIESIADPNHEFERI